MDQCGQFVRIEAARLPRRRAKPLGRRRPVVTAADHGRAISDPIGFVKDLVLTVDGRLTADQIRTVVTGVAGGRAKSRRLAALLAERSVTLTDGRSPAPRAIGDLLIALREAGAEVSPPVCAGCGKPMRTLQRRGQDWYCGSCGFRPLTCAACGQQLHAATRDRAGQPRCAQCPDRDDRDPIGVIHSVITRLDPDVDRDLIATAVGKLASRPSHQRRIGWALEAQPELLTGAGYLAPVRAIVPLIEALHAAGVAGIVRPACPRCHRVVRIDKPLDGQRVCRTCIAHSRIEECVRCGAHREPATRDEQGRPLCPNCLVTDPGQSRSLPQLRAPPLGQSPHAGGPASAELSAPAERCLFDLRRGKALRHLPNHRPSMVSCLSGAHGTVLFLRPDRGHRLRHPGPATLRGLHHPCRLA